MLRLIRWLILGDGHLHHWEHKERVVDYGQGIPSSLTKQLPRSIKYVCRCSICGRIRTFVVE